MQGYSYTSPPPVGRTACTERQCLCKGCTLPFTLPGIGWRLPSAASKQVQTIWYPYYFLSTQSTSPYNHEIFCYTPRMTTRLLKYLYQKCVRSRCLFSLSELYQKTVKTPIFCNVSTLSVDKFKSPIYTNSCPNILILMYLGVTCFILYFFVPNSRIGLT